MNVLPTMVAANNYVPIPLAPLPVVAGVDMHSIVITEHVMVSAKCNVDV